MTYPDAIEYLYRLRWFGAKLGLENTLRLADLFGNPQRRLRFIHVAGTNGKGSTCAMLESIYRAAGLRVGLFTSPHLVSFNERIQVNREPISDADVTHLVARLRSLLENEWPDMASANHPTFFEAVTVMALVYFGEQKCDLVIWETGLGGRLDATNIVTPIASIITNVQYDHQQWLGDSLESIAAEKAGIIKTGVPVITAANERSALRVIEDISGHKNAPLIRVDTSDIAKFSLDTSRLALSGQHQRLNAAIAAVTVRALADQISVRNDLIQTGLAQVQWAGRFQLVATSSGQRILLDGAHNISGAETLVAALNEYFPSIEKTLVLGILQDKDWRRICEILSPLASRILLVPVASDRSASPEELGKACRHGNPRAQVIEYANFKEAFAGAKADSFVVVAGSLYLVGEALEVMQLSPSRLQSERGLNEWTGQVPPSQAATC